MSQEKELVEYQTLTDRLNATDAWGHHFVALYFAFTSALFLTVGSAVYYQDGLSKQPVWIFQNAYTFAILAAAALGISSTMWGISMIVDYDKRTKLFQKRMRQLERRFYPATPSTGVDDEPNSCMAHRELSLRERGNLTIWLTLSVRATMFSLLCIWILLISAAFQGNHSTDKDAARVPKGSETQGECCSLKFSLTWTTPQNAKQ